jgi:hypothetical protein
MDATIAQMASTMNTPVQPLTPNFPAAVPVQTAGANEELTTTTDLSEVRNTADIEKLFNQFGGKSKKDKEEHDSSSSESDSLSDFDDSITVSD